MLSALSDERTDLSFAVAAGPRQRSHFRTQVPWDLWPYFTVSDSRLPFSSPPTTRRATLEVFDPASTWDCPVLSAGPRYIASERIAVKTHLSTVLLLHDVAIGPGRVENTASHSYAIVTCKRALSSNDCFSCSIIFAFSRHTRVITST
jgi:hypothetical protein